MNKILKLTKRCASIVMLISLISMRYDLNAVVVGSNSVSSVQGTVIFPSADTNNTMLGFAAFENGFILQDSKTTVTFNDVFPVSGPVTMNGGTVILQRDINFFNINNVQAFGKFIGNSYSIEFAEACSQLCLTNASNEQCFTSLTLTSSFALSSIIRCVKWSYDDTYIAVGADAVSGPEVRVWSFDGTDLTSVASKEIGQTVYSIDWHPSQNVLAVVSKNITGESGADVAIYSLSGNTLTKLDAEAFPNSNWWGYGVSWSPDGNYLAVTLNGTLGSHTTEIKVYSFNGSTLTFVDFIDVHPSNTVVSPLYDDSVHSTNAVTWSPDGKYIAIGLQQEIDSVDSPGCTDSSCDWSELQVYGFDGTNITFKDAVNIDLAVLSVDWCSNANGSFIAAGLQEAGSNLVRIYQFNTSTKTLSEATSAREGENHSVHSVDWSSSCQCLLLGLNNAATSEVKIYTFDSVDKTLTAPITATSAYTVYSAVFSHNQLYVATGDSNCVLNVYTLGQPADDSAYNGEKLIFENTKVIFNSDVQFKVPVRFRGDSCLDARGYKIEFVKNGLLQVDTNSNLTILNTHFSNVAGNNISNLSNSSSIILRNSELTLSKNFTFSNGSFSIASDSVISGTNTFIYSTRVTSTIQSGSTLLLDKGITFSYGPLNGRNNLLYMPDQTAVLYMNGSTLHSTFTGLCLSTGTLALDNHCTLTSEARNSGEALQFDPSLNICVLGGATADLFGKIKYC